MKNPFPKVRQFLKETSVELKRLTLPTRQELRTSVIVVFVAIALLGVFVSVVDFAVYNVVDLFTSFVTGGK